MTRRGISKEESHVANINRQIADELGVREQQVAATVELLNGGATVPFIARYRKEKSPAASMTRSCARWMSA
jgi:transcriptional accessory protein Tex/SPT6